ncbi:L-threonylcarbamoyladenylate synthase [Borreliella burgdorferi]|uniref:Threonylcarbamoyl-AMP synthase n=3 Tax=Borreliella burgdorferi TaxID=139 RepID=Q9R3N4_BORBU|nr:L-threonylcarbamoyladenylate synthase [Borreliella burgdorferi]AAF07698.1 Sua5/YciO/YrdC/YwlC family protein, putative [Borreliella burgdorferi B31]AAF08548.1 Sua5/YciO/YrdC/YwlC family protein, putative [Borreliella burgdorferi B31]AAQ81893.1 conserved hypothetical protein [Borreliella burgdorferi]EEC21401.1 putative Sua5/YciO/YrdC/YwlC family protein [Borreliella burgdorferi 156a]MCD2320817.1 threonylcarbamoyl-AMP synthase [Borreliella burgdorferi]
MIKTPIISEDQFKIALKLIKMGEIIVFPTDTVYAIGANIYDEYAVRMINLVKKKSINEPLMLYVDTIEKIKELSSHVPKSAKILMEKFSPGPLTYVLKKSIKIPKFINNNLDTVAIRIPKNKTALNLIRKLKNPLVVSSANLSKRPSSTSFSMALKELNGLVGGIIMPKKNKDSNIGIESTIIEFDSKDNVIILRPGAITKKMIEKVLGSRYKVNYAKETKIDLKKMFSYRLRIPVHTFKRGDNIRKYLKTNTKVLITRDTFKFYFFSFLWDKKNIILFDSLIEYAENLYKELVNAEEKYDQVIVEIVENEELGYAINNRIVKASSNNFM